MKDKYANQIKALKAVAGFTVKGADQRRQVVKTAWAMKQFGLIDFEVATREVSKGEFLVFAGKV